MCDFIKLNCFYKVNDKINKIKEKFVEQDKIFRNYICNEE